MKKQTFLILTTLLSLSFFGYSQDSSATPSSLSQQPEQPQLLVQDSAEASSQNQRENTSKAENGDKVQGFDWEKNMPWIIAGLALLFGVYQFLLRKRITKGEKINQLEAEDEFKQRKYFEQKKFTEKRYRDRLARKYGSLVLLYGKQLDPLDISLDDTFVTLHVHQYSTTESEDTSTESEGSQAPPADLHHIRSVEHPDKMDIKQLLKQAFNDHRRLLVIVGDPGSGKTTIMKKYMMICLNKNEVQTVKLPKNILPIFLPLRELAFPQYNEPEDFVACIQRMISQELNLDITEEIIKDWLENRETLVLLDGLDEIRELQHRKAAVKRIHDMIEWYEKGRFVVTTRGAGYDRTAGYSQERIKFAKNRHEAFVEYFTDEQQETFLSNWFRAVLKAELPLKIRNTKRLEQKIDEDAKKQVASLREYLQHTDNESIRQLADNPIQLQLIAIAWKYRKYLPKNRAQLYRITIEYLLEQREKERGIFKDVAISSEDILRVIKPVALTMLEQIKKDFIHEDRFKEIAEPVLRNLPDAPPINTFFQYLWERSGLFSSYRTDHWMFRHKSVLEYIAALQLRDECQNNENRISEIVGYFRDGDWREPLRFFMNLSDAAIFSRFFKSFFYHPVSEELDTIYRDLMITLVKDAPERGEISALVICLNDPEMTINRLYYIIDCLKTIDTLPAYKALADFVNLKSNTTSSEPHNYAIEAVLSSDYSTSYYPVIDMLFVEVDKKELQNVISETLGGEDAELVEAEEIRPGLEIHFQERVTTPKILYSKLEKKPTSFRNMDEINAEYILIPGGSYIYQKGNKELERKVTVPDFYLAKYPVTNQRYRKFIHYLAGEEADLQATLPTDAFTNLLMHFAKSDRVDDKKYIEYLGDPGQWAKKLRSRLDDDKRFNGEEQPVVGVSWYVASAYCLWLSCLELAKQGAKPQLEKAAILYRLPDETEWEWAAGGGKREYPWGDDKPTEKHANYGKNVGATTPVGRYPEGATPEGLLDMAGNVWEWQENWSPTRKGARSLRGGAWHNSVEYLRCSARNLNNPDNDIYNYIGFRVLRSQSI